mmetsp:Transcript_10438/g.12695  ORF Transcript_10438/g.12695 Transcript_10438/m.12695 type:complete len:366 (+) Transcript_10438:68-1165(+)
MTRILSFLLFYVLVFKSSGEVVKPNIIIDTDPGGDDVMAILWAISAARSGDIKIAAITTVGGNVSPDLTYAAAFKTMMSTGCCPMDPEDCGDEWRCPQIARAVPGQVEGVYDGFSGADGLGGLSERFPIPDIPFYDAQTSDQVIIKTLLDHPPGTVSIVALGPLTNLAKAELSHPGILNLAKEVIAMAGAFEVPGNITPDAEFNVLQDPLSYKQVLALTDITFLPLDITMSVTLLSNDVNRLTSFSSSLKNRSDKSEHLLGFVSDLWHFLTEQSLNFKQTDGDQHMIMHDSAAIGYVLYPSLFSLRRGRVFVDAEPTSYSFGRTLLDRRLKVSQRTNAFVAFGVEGKKLIAAFVEDLQTLLETVR